mmetsp:Transcript_7107/g.14247  ORF Transcript_7107/g.14247 Transcript_7107/m.14247 type:complete len:90 (+) Transcript_7107:65-334(+)
MLSKTLLFLLLTLHPVLCTRNMQVGTERRLHDVVSLMLPTRATQPYSSLASAINVSFARRSQTSGFLPSSLFEGLLQRLSEDIPRRGHA